MEGENVVCPVCTLFLRPGITLKAHLNSHPKQKVIEALVKIANNESEPKSAVSQENPWNAPPIPMNVYPNFGTMPGNHSFIYQQFMSSSASQQSLHNVNPLTQQVVTIPTVFNSQMMCPPYVYQQQQVIMSSGPSVLSIVPKPLPIELPESSESSPAPPIEDIEDFVEEPELVEISELSRNETDYSSDRENQEGVIMEIAKEESQIEMGLSCKEDTTDDMPSDSLNTDMGDVEECSAKSTEYNTDDAPHILQDYTVKCNIDLSKSCQTQTVNGNYTETIDEDDEVAYIPAEIDKKSSCYYTEVQENVSNTFTNYERSETHTATLFTSTTPPEQIPTVADVNDVNVFLNTDFLSNRLVSQVDDFECANANKPRIILNLSDLNDLETNYRENSREQTNEESLSSRESANIRTDEHMPPRGELSGQESNGATSDANWNHRSQFQEVCSSYDLIARENWSEDLSADNEPNRSDSICCDDDTPTVSGFREPPITYKCPTCGEAFNCPKERRVHQREHHRVVEKKEKEIIGPIGVRKVKKLTIKPKRSEEPENNNFDNVFTNRLKLETTEADRCIPQPNLDLNIDKKENVNDPNICTECDLVVADNNALRRHQFEAHNLTSDKKHKCKTCEMIFPTETKYNEHLKIHPLECRLCGKYFYRKQNMQMHMKRHLGIKPYKCGTCEKAFLTKQKLEEHKNVHTGDAPIKCNLCDEGFRRHSNLVQHRNRHHFNLKRKTKDYVCSCGEVFHSKRKLAWHKEIHDIKPKSCPHCSEKFIHMSSLTRHIRRAHNNSFLPNKERISENVECPICKGVYLRPYLDMHIRNHSGHKPFTCLICNKNFTTKWNLKLHKWTHASRTSKPFKCDQCKGAFIREADYVAHMNAHKSVKPYTCNYCGAQFIRKYNCQRHVREHERVKTYSCHVCGKSFHRSYYLKDHIRVHSGVRPYTCHICGKTSTTKSNHNKHVRIHHAREPVSTEN